MDEDEQFTEEKFVAFKQKIETLNQEFVTYVDLSVDKLLYSFYDKSEKMSVTECKTCFDELFQKTKDSIHEKSNQCIKDANELKCEISKLKPESSPDENKAFDMCMQQAKTLLFL